MRKSLVKRLMKRLAIPLMELLATPLSHQKTVAKRLVIDIPLVKQLAIPLSNQKTVAKWLVIGYQKALHSHSAKPPKDGDISRWLALHSQSTKQQVASRWLTAAKGLVILKLLGVAAALTLSTTVSALGMGGINVTSGLGQPLKADIELVAVSKTEKASLVARLASPDIYKGAGLEYPYGNKFKFQIESRANGEPYLRVTSAQPINDPFVIMLVELTWSSGKLLREYTFLLDPPGYVAEQPVPAEVQAVAPAVQAVPPETAAKPVEQAAPAAAMPVESQPVAEPVMAMPVEQAAGEPTAKSVVTGNITVHRGDTLNRIARQNKPADVSLERMLVALYRVNADQFDGKNMNRIRAGKILRLPDQNELMNVAQPDAAKEIRAQAADWNAYRQKLAGAAAASSQTQAAQQVAAGKITSSVADKAPVAKESAREVLKLSKGEAPGDQAATGTGGKSMTAQDKKNAAQEDAIAKAKTLKEGQARTAMLEKNLEDMQRLAQLKSAALAQPPGAASEVAAVSEVTAASEVKPAAKPKPKEVEPGPSLLDQILGEPLYLVGGAAALLGLIGLGWVMIQRKKEPSFDDISKFSEDAGSTTGRMTAPVAPSPETGDFTRAAAAAKTEATPQSSDVDPISEADLFLNFGRDVQAEEILKEALKNTPNNHQIHLKLLGIYASRKDVNSFAAIAQQLQDSGDEEASQQASAMGRKLEPNNPMYGGAGTIEDAGSATMQTAAFNAMPGFVPDDTATAQALALDFDLGAPSAKAAPSPERNFLGNPETTMIMSAAGMAAAQEAAMDFDVTATHPSIPAAGGPTASPNLEDLIFDVTDSHPSIPVAGGPTASPNLDDLIFDVTSTHPSMPAAQPEAGKPAQADDGGMEFTLNFPVEDIVKKSAPEAQPAGIGLAGISLNFDDAAAPGESAPEGKDEHWQEVATKLDLAKAYQEMDDASGAREILEEVLREGDTGQREAAQTLLAQLG